jgi:uncharacterized membrane protein
MAMINPFDPKTTLLAKHAQHVVLIHFPIALFITAVAFDLIAQWTKRRGLAHAAYYNLLMAAISTVPVLATGLLAWQFQLEGKEAEGHPVAAPRSGVCFDGDDLAGVVGAFPRSTADRILTGYRFAVELLAVGLVALTGHLGRFSKRRKRTPG